jgi:hypothetical protein
MDSLTFTIDSLLNVATVVNDTVAVSVSNYQLKLLNRTICSLFRMPCRSHCTTN